jgi:hypothetical protein
MGLRMDMESWSWRCDLESGLCGLSMPFCGFSLFSEYGVEDFGFFLLCLCSEFAFTGISSVFI